jgi:hypothetical protein
MSLIVDIESYLHRTGIAETTFGRRAVNDPRLVGDLRRGRRPGPLIAGRVKAIIGARP